MVCRVSVRRRASKLSRIIIRDILYCLAGVAVYFIPPFAFLIIAPIYSPALSALIYLGMLSGFIAFIFLKNAFSLPFRRIFLTFFGFAIFCFLAHPSYNPLFEIIWKSPPGYRYENYPWMWDLEKYLFAAVNAFCLFLMARWVCKAGENEKASKEIFIVSFALTPFYFAMSLPVIWDV